MNTKNNKKFQETEQMICNTFLELLNKKSFNAAIDFEICREAGITRATFYAHCKDTRELMSRTDAMLSADMASSCGSTTAPTTNPGDWKTVSGSFSTT